MRPAPKRLMRLFALLLALSLVAAACGDDEETEGGASGSAASEGISGSVNISGSSTVEPISSLVSELLADENDGIEVTVDGPGTGDGFKLFCNGETDISDASRPIKPEEAAACKTKGIEFIELKIAFDGIAVLTSADNKMECLNFADLYAMIGVEATAKKWSDASALAAELGSKTKLPDTDLDIFGPGEESGTYDSFIEIALQKIGEKRAEGGKITKEKAVTTRTDYEASPNDNVIIEGIEGSKSSLGWVGFAFAEEAGDEVTEIAIAKEPGGACVKPTKATIADASYPLSRGLYIYVNKAKLDANKAVTAYVDFYLDEGYGAVEDAGYVALPDDQLKATKARWTAKTVGAAAG